MERDIVHVLDTLDRGGIETWLMHVLRASSRVRERSLLCTTTGKDHGPNTYRDEIDAMGVPVHRLGHARGLRFTLALAAHFRRLRPRVVHVHMSFLSGWAVSAARLAGVPQRIAHYHVTFPARHDNFFHRNYIRFVRALEKLSATHVLACSVAAHETYCGPAWRRDPRRQLLYYGIDLDPFEQRVRPTEVRSDLGIPEDAFVIGHVGGFRIQKNHSFVLDVAAAMFDRLPSGRLLLIGDGKLRPEIEGRIRELGISDRVILAGVRPDVVRLMLGAMDVFFFPSLNEGLGIVLVEAQAAGVSCVFTDVVPPEATIIDELCHRLSLDEPRERWVDALLACRESAAKIDRRAMLDQVKASRFNIETAIHQLEHIYL